jgi:ActR/RegA family two-component response regulator
MLTRVLLVEPDAAKRALLRRSVLGIAHVDGQSGFWTALRHLLGTPVKFLVTNLQLGEYNGLHLVYLASTAGISGRCIVYSDRRDIGLAREAQRLGAFYETRDCLLVTLSAYLQGALPERDRRDSAVPDRRPLVRTGRRCWDHHVAGSLEVMG